MIKFMMEYIFGHSADEGSFTFSAEDACNLRHHIAETLASTARRGQLDFTPGSDVEVIEADSPKGTASSTAKSLPNPDSLDDGAEIDLDEPYNIVEVRSQKITFI